MGDRLKAQKERSQKRKQLLAQAFGVESPDVLKTALKSKEEIQVENKAANRNISDSGPDKNKSNAVVQKTADGAEGAQTKEKGEEEFETEEVYTDSSAFLKGTQSANPHNDYCQHFVDTGERPQNFIRDVGLANRFEEYPKLRELIRLKDELIGTTNIPPTYMKVDLETFSLAELGCQFDVILLEPPLEEYQRTHGAVFEKYWDWDEIESLDIQSVAAQRSFIWIWCGNAEGLERGRQCLKVWGYRRCEDICWIKTNIKNPGHNKHLEPHSIMQRTKEHCLMGIKGTVKRSTDGDFIHANVDIDLIIEDEPPYGCKDKPVEIFHIIEHFCLGRRRLHIFARDSTIRPGWLSIGPELTSSNYEQQHYQSHFQDTVSLTTGCSEEIERLRPKSPVPKSKQMGGNTRGQRGGRGGASRGGPPGMMRGRGAGPGRGGQGRGMRGGGRGPPRGGFRGGFDG